MPIKKAAIKSLKQSKKNALVNQRIKSRIKNLKKKFLKEAKVKNKEEAKKIFLQIQQTLDKACQKNIIKSNKAARDKSRLSKILLN